MSLNFQPFGDPFAKQKMEQEQMNQFNQTINNIGQNALQNRQTALENAIRMRQQQQQDFLFNRQYGPQGGPQTGDPSQIQPDQTAFGPSIPNPLSLFRGPQTPQNIPQMGSGRGVLDHWDTQFPHLSSAPGAGQSASTIPIGMSRADYQENLANQKTQADIQKSLNDNFQLIGNTNDNKAIMMNKKNGQIEIKDIPGGMQQKGYAAATTKDASYANASPQEQSLADAMVNGNIRAGDLSFRDRGRIVAMANERAKQLGVPFQSYAGNVKERFAENMSSGKIGMNSLSLNTGLGHIGDLMDSFDKLGNSDTAFLNTPLNKLKEKTNDPNVIAVGLNLNALKGELANVFKNSGGTDQEIASWSEYLNRDLTPLQAQAAAKKIGELLTSRLSAIDYQKQNVMGSTDMNRQFMSPHATDVMNRIKGNQPLTAVNKQTGQRIQSLDGGKTWQPAQ